MLGHLGIHHLATWTLKGKLGRPVGSGISSGPRASEGKEHLFLRRSHRRSSKVERLGGKGFEFFFGSRLPASMSEHDSSKQPIRALNSPGLKPWLFLNYTSSSHAMLALSHYKKEKPDQAATQKVNCKLVDLLWLTVLRALDHALAHLPAGLGGIL